ncbi:MULTISPECIES: molybdenum cofactor biosynthesis protein MoaE [Liquorilactobacillus]|uniref:molybdenum cofactor biosynthesis protein MoaE n=1 Tax=Liquorilactobacillus TaxID=2767888 RepID=UPI0039E8C100
MYYLRISTEPIDVDSLYRQLQSPVYGGIVIFAGTVRQWTGKIETKSITYSAYIPMAEKVLNDLAAPIEQKGARVIIVHRLGQLKLTDTAVFIGVAAAHRKAAFSGCQYLIDTLKEQAPIWKKEFDVDKIRWGR